ncbi:hypothetical protein K030075H31_56570 [Blautia producta]
MRPLNFSLEKPNAIKLELKIEPTMFTTTMTAEFKKYLPKESFVNASLKLSKLNREGIHLIGTVVISLFVMNALRTIQKNGNSMVMDITINNM